MEECCALFDRSPDEWILILGMRDGGTIALEQNPGGWESGAISGVAVDRKGTIYEIQRGENSDNGSPFDGTTDVAFAPNGHIFISDGYGNARVLEYTANGKRVGQWGKSGNGIV